VAADHSENDKPVQGSKDLGAEAGDQEPEAAGNPPSALKEDQSHQLPDTQRKVVKRPAPDSLARFPASEFYRSQFSAAEQIRKIMGGSVAEQMRKAMGGTVASQMQDIMRGSLGEQMRQAQQALRPLGSLQDTVGRLARTMVESPMQRILDEQASRHRQVLEALSPKWNQTLVAHAFTESLSAIQSFQSIPQAEILRTKNAIRQQLSSITTLLEPLRTKFRSLHEISEFWATYPARVKENLVALAAAGWYLDPEMDLHDIVNFKENLENGTVEEVNDELALHFLSSLDRIEEALCADHPERAHLIREAFAAHREGRYSLSIPALFAQADGICYDLTGYQIFAGNGIYRFAKRLDPETLERAYLEPLLRTIPIADSSRQRRAKIPQLNRHAVMHGESTDFPSEQNGLKAISFVNFVSHVLGMAIAWKNEMATNSEKEQPTILH